MIAPVMIAISVEGSGIGIVLIATLSKKIEEAREESVVASNESNFAPEPT
jgi:hypothetical protein